jgi:23S rRNA pseudouridine2605 synthase
LGSRTDARKWIGSGRVRVNGRLVQTPDHWVDLERDQVTLDGKPVGPPTHIYLLLYKPKGYLTTHKDPQGRPTVYDLIPDVGKWVVPVGRLDWDTTGLLILTNDTQLAEHLMNPEHLVPKTYLVKASRHLTDEELDGLRDGVLLSDGPTAPAQVKRVRDSEKYSFIEITIREGRNRQVRRMIEVIGATALKLVRTQIGSLRIADLPIGTYRQLTAAEVAELFGQKT